MTKDLHDQKVEAISKEVRRAEMSKVSILFILTSTSLYGY
jgi:hypothetical protein